MKISKYRYLNLSVIYIYEIQDLLKENNILISFESSNEVLMEFLVKNKTPAMTSKMHLAPFSLARNLAEDLKGK